MGEDSSVFQANTCNPDFSLSFGPPIPSSQRLPLAYEISLRPYLFFYENRKSKKMAFFLTPWQMYIWSQFSRKDTAIDTASSQVNSGDY